MIDLEINRGRSALWNESLRLEFTLQGDHWGHRLCWATPSGWREVLCCAGIESATEESVPSPVFQEIFTRRGADGGGEVMLLGQLTAHVFSGSFRLAPDRPRLRIEVADRLRQPIGLRRSGITYQAPAGARSLDLSDHPIPGWRVASVLVPEIPLALAFVMPLSPPSDPGPARSPEFHSVPDRAIFSGLDAAALPPGPPRSRTTLRYALDLLAVPFPPPDPAAPLDPAVIAGALRSALEEGIRG